MAASTAIVPFSEVFCIRAFSAGGRGGQQAMGVPDVG
jgi:hypothetical protein